jgi:hypothetical protein
MADLSRFEGAEDRARERYTADLRAERQAMREALRFSVGEAHVGLVLTLILLAPVAWFGHPHAALITAGVFAAWFALALTFIVALGGRGWNAVGRAYAATFGWAQWF